MRRGRRGDDVEPGSLPVAVRAVRLLGLDAEVLVLKRARRDTEQFFTLTDVIVGSCQHDAAFSRAAALLAASVKLLLGHE